MVKKLFRWLHKDNRGLKVFIFVLVFYVTFILRAHNYERVPSPSHLDEMMYAWSGINLIETGVPISWSTLDYPARAEVYKGTMSYLGGDPQASVALYKPWLDQPPLFSLIAGGFAHIYGADKNGFMPSSYIRMPVVLMGAVTSIFVFLIMRLVSGYWTGILAMTIYGTVPLLVFASRSALAENFIAMNLMITVYLMIKFVKSPRFFIY